MIACREMRLRPAPRAGPTTDTRRQTHSGVGVAGVATCRHRHLAADNASTPA